MAAAEQMTVRERRLRWRLDYLHGENTRLRVERAAALREAARISSTLAARDIRLRELSAVPGLGAPTPTRDTSCVYCGRASHPGSGWPAVCHGHRDLPALDLHYLAHDPRKEVVAA